MLAYWDDSFKNELGEDLTTCMAKYGVGTEQGDAQSDFTVVCVFLDATKDFGNSWLLRVDMSGGFVPAYLYYSDPGVLIKEIDVTAASPASRARQCSRA